VDRTHTISLATTSAVGVVKPDGTTITIDGTGKITAVSSGGGGGGGGSTGEVPSGSLNGSNTAFTLTLSPNPSSSLLLLLNGVEQDQGTDYTLSGSSIAYAVAPKSSDWHYAVYGTGGSGGAAGIWASLYNLTAPPVYSAWSWLNQGTATGGDVTGLGVYLRAPAVAGTNLRVLKRALGAAPWDIHFCALEAMYPSGNTRSGIALYESTTGKLTTLGPSQDASRNVDHWNSTTSFASGGMPFNSNIVARGPLVFWRIRNDGTNLIYYVSMDGVNWVQIGTEPITAFFTTAATDAGFFIDSEGNSYDVLLTVIHWTIT
jgi:hypothetical protein